MTANQNCVKIHIEQMVAAVKSRLTRAELPVVEMGRGSSGWWVERTVGGTGNGWFRVDGVDTG